MDYAWLGILNFTALSEEEKQAVEDRCRARYHWNTQRRHNAEVVGDEVVVYETVGNATAIIGRYPVVAGA